MDKDAKTIETGLTVMDIVDNPKPMVLTEHIIELLNAEQEGRLIVLPCPIGTPVYVHRHLCHGMPRGIFNGDCWLIQDCPRNGLQCPEEVREEKFTIAMREGLGKWFWLTREEAEAALPPERRNRK